MRRQDREATAKTQEAGKQDRRDAAQTEGKLEHAKGSQADTDVKRPTVERQPGKMPLPD